MAKSKKQRIKEKAQKIRCRKALKHIRASKDKAYWTDYSDLLATFGPAIAKRDCPTKRYALEYYDLKQLKYPIRTRALIKSVNLKLIKEQIAKRYQLRSGFLCVRILPKEYEYREPQVVTTHMPYTQALTEEELEALSKSKNNHLEVY